MKGQLYMIKSNINPNLCPLCNSELKFCHIGEYCSNDECSYVDGYANLTKKEALKYKDKLINKKI